MKVANGDDVEVQHVGNVVLILDHGYELVLKDTFYIPFFRRNLVSISALDNVGYEFNFRNNKDDIFYDSEKIGESVLTSGLYKLCTSLSNECLHVENCSTKRSKTKNKSFVLWHKRLGHISRERVDHLVKYQILPHLDYSDIACVDCAKGKLTKTGKKSTIRNQIYLSPYGVKQSRLLFIVLNRVPRKSVPKTPFELWIGRKPSLNYFQHSKGFRFYCPTRGTRIVEPLTAKFLELDVAENSSSQPSETPESSKSVSIPLPSLTEAFPPMTVREETVTLPTLDEDPGMLVPEIPQHHDLVPDIPQGHDPVPEISQVHEPAQEFPLRRSQRERRPAINADYHVYLGEADYDTGHVVDPATFKEALHRLQSDLWKSAMDDEMLSMSTSVDYHVYLGEANYDIGHAVDPATFKEALHSPQYENGLVPSYMPTCLIL
ncbi:Retrovirus-related Pol polyprotein from transposon TNT 1-94 [Senna tora]|uniref:Retrovirus-related Pol polyprotein from transposon TNT 1-94 n=1 Tax=Senna tora TaxID=362788 RepID=A0A834TQQ9_9FABA|nr:Retrovirus-related Pol polyprotein from transposon TNT 1-94 [Senna tora]